MEQTSPAGVQLLAPPTAQQDRVLTPEALAFLASLERRFRAERAARLVARTARQRAIAQGAGFEFLQETAWMRDGEWQVAPAPADLDDRRVEITGPVDRKMMINALNSGAKVFMADFEDATSPTWENLVEGQANCIDAVRRALAFRNPAGREYRLGDRPATLVVRPRGWHLVESHVLVDDAPMSGSLFDFGLYFFHNAREQLSRGSGPYFYLPKLESHLEARLWNEVFVFAQEALGIPRGSTRATVLIETLPAAFEMEEILYELREHAAGLNAGRWDYIFSAIKKLRDRRDAVLPDRAQVTMAVPFMRAYARRLVATCHRRGAHAIGGMAAFVPSRKDADVNARAMAKVREDKQRESGDGFDGTWVAHPDLVPVAREVFDGVLGDQPNQKHVIGEGMSATAKELTTLAVPGGTVTDAGVRLNVDVALQYLEAWLRGQGAVAIHNLMEDAATAEISRAQLWQWIRHDVVTTEGTQVTRAHYAKVRDEELARLEAERAGTPTRLKDAAALLDSLVLGDEFVEFLTIPGYRSITTFTTTTSRGGAGPMSFTKGYDAQVAELDEQWKTDRRWNGITRDYSARDVVRLRGSVRPDYTIARLGAERLWAQLRSEPYVHTFGALTGAQAVQMVKAGLQAVYLSGWQVAADGNLAAQTYPDQSLYPSNSVPALVKRLNNALLRADQIEWSENDGRTKRAWMVPIVADAEAGFGGPLHAYELTKSMIEAGAAGVHFEDQLASEKKCGHMGGKVLVPTSQMLRTLQGARLAADVAGVPTLIVARTDALAANLMTSDIDERDRPFLTGRRTAEGYYEVEPGMGPVITRALAYAPYVDLLWCETGKPDLKQAREFAEAVHARFPGKMLAYNCSPSFNWSRNLTPEQIATFQRELGAMGYKFQFITLAGWHMINLNAFELAHAYRTEGMPAYVRIQDQEFARERDGYTATKHQREAGTGYFDDVLSVITQGQASTGALKGSTEAEQFHGDGVSALLATAGSAGTQQQLQ